MKVRRAGADDLPVLCEMGREFRGEAVFAFPEPVEVEWLGMAEKLGEMYFMAIAEGGAGPVGFITAVQSRYMFSPARHVAQDTFYVKPAYRGSRAALLLVRAVEEWARGLGLGRVVLSINSGITPDRAGRFYQKLGYAAMGGNYMKDFG